MSAHKDQSNVIKMLRKQIADLEDEKQSVKRYTEDFYSSRTKELQSWLQKTTNLIQTAHDLIEDVGKHGKNKCPVGLCLNPQSSYHLRKKAEQICNDIAAHVQKARRFSNIPPSYRQEKVAADRFEDFESRNNVLKDIMEALRSPCINKIGVYGKPGMGKTMLVREVKRRAEQERLFDAVVMATVGRNPDLPKIQDEIARVSNKVTSLEASNSKQAGLIEKKVLMILDDIREPGLSLELLGIMGMEDDALVSYKILLTSRDENFVSPLSETQIEIGKLDGKDAWNLFKKIADDPDKSRGLPFYANEITKKCEDLPIAVATLANALRRRNLIEWKTILRKLQSQPSDQANQSQIPQSLHLAIELHYSGLKSNELQQTFLLCSLLGQNATIQNLLKYGIGLGLFPGAKSIEEARAQVLNLVTKLRDSFLLLDSGSSLYFDMHDLVRDLATSTVSKEHGVLALREDAPNNWSDTEAMESIKWIYLSNGDASRLPYELKCPKLTFFHLSEKVPSLASPQNLFRDKKGLKVLSLSKMNFSSIPPSISLPKNLFTLCLDQVEFGAANIGTMMGELENLQVLSLAGSDIKELPKQIGQLAKLKLLDLSDCIKLKVIPPGVLSGLSGLEELYIRNSFVQWAEGIEEHENQNASLVELKHLKSLTTIEVHIICNIHKIPEGLFSENLARFKVFLGDRWTYWNSSWGLSKLLQLKPDARIGSDHSVRKLLKKTNELHLEGLIGIENVVNELDEEGFQELKHLFVQDALEIQHIISVEHAFPVLEELVLRNLRQMEKICHGLLGAASFGKLRSITIECCNKLKNLFSLNIAKQLQQLQEIRVNDCCDMEEIVDDKEQESGNDAEEPEGHYSVELISLRSLRLQHLPKLIGFNSSCRNMALFNEKGVFSNFEELQLSSIMVNNTIWHNSITSCVEKLTKLIIYSCDNLEYLFSSTMARVLEKLRHLHVKECKKMRIIIDRDSGEEQEKLIFPLLSFLLIEDLQNLVGFSSGNCIVEFPSLKQLRILGCLQLKRFVDKSFTSTNVIDNAQPLFDEKGVFSNLEELQLSSIMVNNTIWQNSMTSCVEKLTKLIIHGCNNLEYLFSSSMAKVLWKLRHLHVKECKRLRMIIDRDYGEQEEKFIFPQLNFLLIEDLQNLVRFYSKNCIVKFPSLKELRISGCLQLKGFIDKSFASTNVIDNAQSLFDQKVVFSNLEELQLSSIMVNKTIWQYGQTSCVKKLTKLIIHGCDNLEYLFSSITTRVLWKLKHLHVKECKRMRMIINGNYEGQQEKLIFPQLNFLLIEDLHNLVGFYCVKFSSRDCIVEFPSLKELRISGCLKLKGFIDKSFASTNVIDNAQPFFDEKVVFSSNLKELQLWSITVISTIWHTSMISHVQTLEKLIILDCNKLKYLFSSSAAQDSEGVIQLFLPNLKRLELGNLPALKSICSCKAAMVCDSLEWIIIWNCNQLRRIPLYLPLVDNGQPSPPPSLKQIAVWSQEWWESLEWDHPNAKDVLLPFYGSCHSVPFELVEGRIKRLEFTDFDGEKAWLLPSVQELVINRCNNLRSLNDISNIKDAKELKCCRMWNCEGVECVLSSSINSLVQKLEVLELSFLDKLDSLFKAEAITKSLLPPDTFSSLKTISVWYCHKIKMLFPFRMCLQSLEEIDIKACKQMEEIIAWDAEEAGRGKEGIIQHILPKLKSLKLIELPTLKSICSRRAVMVCDSLEVIWIDNCKSLRRIPLYLPLLDNGQPSTPPSFKQINVWPQQRGKLWWESLEWDHPNAKDVLLPFRKFNWFI